MRRAAFALFFFIFAIVLPAALALWLIQDAVPGKFSLKKVEFSSLQGWDADDAAPALAAFVKSCETLSGHDFQSQLPGVDPVALKTAFLSACSRARDLTPDDAGAFFADNFEAFRLSVGWKRKGLLTGYYEPLLEGSLEPDPGYPVPLYRNPGDQVTIDLSQFRDGLEGTLTGRLEGNAIVPYHARADIEAGALAGRSLELLWVKDPVNAFFLQIQGSGRVRLPDGALIRVGYASKNGRAYTAIGRVLANEGHMDLARVSLASIRRWLDENPEQMTDILNRNESYVFFRLLDQDGPLGSAGSVLTPARSLAVDPRFIPLGLPVWIAGEMPDPSDPEGDPLPLLRLLIAQDTGGAIKGELRGDVFWGFGGEAETLAGYMKHQARFYLLLPRGAVPADAD